MAWPGLNARSADYLPARFRNTSAWNPARVTIALRRPHVARFSAPVVGRSLKRFAAVWLKRIGIQLALFAAGLVWTLVATTASIAVYTARLVWSYRFTALACSRRSVLLLGPVAVGARRRSRPDLTASLYLSSRAHLPFVALFAAIALGGTLGWIGAHWLVGHL